MLSPVLTWLPLLVRRGGRIKRILLLVELVLLGIECLLRLLRSIKALLLGRLSLKLRILLQIRSLPLLCRLRRCLWQCGSLLGLSNGHDQQNSANRACTEWNAVRLAPTTRRQKFFSIFDSFGQSADTG